MDDEKKKKSEAQVKFSFTMSLTDAVAVLKVINLGAKFFKKVCRNLDIQKKLGLSPVKVSKAQIFAIKLKEQIESIIGDKKTIALLEQFKGELIIKKDSKDSEQSK